MKKCALFLLVLLLVCGCASAEGFKTVEGKGFSIRCPESWAVSGTEMPVTMDGDSGILVLTANDLGMAYTAEELLLYKIPTVTQNILTGGNATDYLDAGSVLLLGHYEMVETRFLNAGKEYVQVFCPVGTVVYQFTLTGNMELIEQILSSFVAY